MRISELIKFLEDIRRNRGDCEIKAFHHEGGNSLRAYPGSINNDSFVEWEGVLTIGGYYP